MVAQGGQRDLSLPTFYGITSRGVVPAGLTSAHGCSASIDLAGGVDTTGGGRALARHPRHQDRHQDGPERDSTHPSLLPGELISTQL